MPVRLLTPFEKNHLLKFGFDPDQIAEYGEEPVEYITGFAQFLGQDLIVNKNVLIPRVETEELISKIIEFYTEHKEVKFLEVGTGSGAIGLTIFRKLKARKIAVKANLVDISNEALEVSRQNLDKLIDKKDRQNIEIFQSDLLTKVSSLTEFDFCVANLPYIPSSRLKNLSKSVIDFEPMLALDGGEDGLKVISELIKQLNDKKFKGDLFLEVDDTHDSEKLIKLDDSFKTIWLDEFGKNRFAWFDFKQKA